MGILKRRKWIFPTYRKTCGRGLVRTLHSHHNSFFPSLNDLEYVKSTIETISDEMGVRYYERDAVENMVGGGIQE
jgi:hypothetical protein